VHNATKNTPDPATNPDASTRGLYEGTFSILLADQGEQLSGRDQHAGVVDERG